MLFNQSAAGHPLERTLRAIVSETRNAEENEAASSSERNHILLPEHLDIRGTFSLVPGGGVEPPRAEARRILSPLRLPVPPSRLFRQMKEAYTG